MTDRIGAVGAALERSERPRRFRRAVTQCVSAGVLVAAIGGAADVQMSVVDMQTKRDAVDDVGCSTPGIGNFCVTVTCSGCDDAIPDSDELVQTIDVTEAALAGIGVRDCNVNRLNFALELTHGDVGDLRVSLAHGATDVFLYDPDSSCNATSVDAIFSDLGLGPANACPASSGGTFLPDEPLQAFAGTPLDGSWTLTTADLVALDSGMMERWRFAADVTCTPITTPPGCTPGQNVMCLGAGDRFKVEALWLTDQGANGSGRVVELTPDTGYMWFFNEENIELVVKVLNGCGINNRYWVFAGGLTDVQVRLDVTDTETGAKRSYFNPQKTAFQPVQDTSAFATCP